MSIPKIKRIFLTSCLTMLAILIVFIVNFPIIWVISTSLKPYGGLFTSKLTILPENPTLSSFQYVLFESNFFLWLKNSLIVSITTVIILVFLSFPGAYALSRFKFFGKKTTLYSLLITQFIPSVLVLIPLYTILARLRLLNSLITLSLVYVAGGIPWSMWLMKTYLDGIPRDLDEAAIVDGASYFRIAWYILFPLAKPSIMVIVFLNFLGSMGEFLIANVILEPGNWTLPIGLYRMIIQYQTPWNKFAAMALLISIPSIIVYAIGQHYLRTGLTLTGIKG
ncbi:MAG: ABC transporter permease subunit [Candidatus Bathyarchaeia archaeon]